MKQHITVEQLHELSPKARKKLELWVTKDIEKDDWKFGCVLRKYNIYDYMLNIGQMIEFLDENDFYINYFMEQFTTKEKKYWEITYLWLDKSNVLSKQEICDALWEAVKEVLNEKTV